MFLFQRRSSTLFVITRSSSLLRVSVDIKNSVEKESTLLFCFLSKSPVGHRISRQKHLELSVLSYLLTGLFYIGMPVVRTDGKHYMVAHHIVVQHKLIEHCAQRLVSSTHFSKLLFSVLSTPRLSLVSFYVLLCPY